VVEMEGLLWKLQSWHFFQKWLNLYLIHRY
jgi:hypothetical protein